MASVADTDMDADTHVSTPLSRIVEETAQDLQSGTQSSASAGAEEDAEAAMKAAARERLQRVGIDAMGREYIDVQAKLQDLSHSARDLVERKGISPKLIADMFVAVTQIMVHAGIRVCPAGQKWNKKHDEMRSVWAVYTPQDVTLDPRDVLASFASAPGETPTEVIERALALVLEKSPRKEGLGRVKLVERKPRDVPVTEKPPLVVSMLLQTLCRAVSLNAKLQASFDAAKKVTKTQAEAIKEAIIGWLSGHEANRTPPFAVFVNGVARWYVLHFSITPREAKFKDITVRDVQGIATRSLQESVKQLTHTDDADEGLLASVVRCHRELWGSTMETMLPRTDPEDSEKLLLLDADAQDLSQLSMQDLLDALRQARDTQPAQVPIDAASPAAAAASPEDLLARALREMEASQPARPPQEDAALDIGDSVSQVMQPQDAAHEVERSFENWRGQEAARIVEAPLTDVDTPPNTPSEHEAPRKRKARRRGSTAAHTRRATRGRKRRDQDTQAQIVHSPQRQRVA